MRVLLCALSCFVATGCLAFPQPDGVRISSDPPGATILVDGEDSGHLTPAFIDLGDDDARIDLELDGYETATRIIRSGFRLGAIHWNEMSIGPHTWRLPFWIDYDDFLAIIKLEDLYRPTRIYVRLRLSGES